MGRRAQPGAVKAAKAPVRSTRKPAAVSADQVQEGGTKAPAWLKGEGLAIWQKRGPVLRQARLLAASDELAFARYCRNFALWIKLRADLDKRGYTYDASTTNGGTLRRADPSFLIADRVERQLLAVEDRFGLSPSERQKIMAARANQPTGGLFGDERAAADPAAQPAEAATPEASPIGLLN